MWLWDLADKNMKKFRPFKIMFWRALLNILRYKCPWTKTFFKKSKKSIFEKNLIFLKKFSHENSAMQPGHSEPKSSFSSKTAGTGVFRKSRFQGHRSRIRASRENSAMHLKINTLIIVLITRYRTKFRIPE